jgi:formylglycine-generating enzyme required for sulfatase activity/serine/threonine protein kinase
MNAPPPPHPTDQVLYDYGVGKLGDPAASEVDLHLEACPACRQRVSELSGDSFVGRLRDAGARPNTPAPGPAPSGEAKKADGPSNPASVPSPDPDLARSLPPEIGDNPQYQVLRELGSGGMGVVYLARNTLMDRLEVLKVLNKEMLERKGTYDRFLREVRAAARLAHPNVVGAYSAVQVGRLLVFAMEYVEGADLAQLVKTKGPLPVAHACSFAAQAALGLQHAYERGMVHRDIKPANLMLMRQGQRGIVKILDFGLAKASSENPIDGGLTREGQMLGTPHYISPEQTVDAQNADIRADIYSLGCTLYYLLTGGPPFDGKTLLEILTGHHSLEARPLNLVRPEVPVELAAVVGKMMAKERERRYQTPAEVAEALKPFFKPKVVGSGSSDGERSQPGQQDEERTSAGVVSPAAEPAGAEPVAAPGAAAPPNDPALMWKSLVAIAEPEHLSDTRAPAPEVLQDRPPWVGPALVVGIVVLLGLVVGWAAGVFKFKPQEGELAFSNLPERAVVTVDGKLYTVEWPGGKGPAKVTVPVGEHRVKVELNGVEVHGEEVKIATGEKTLIRVILAGPSPLAPSPTTMTNSIGMKFVLIPAGEFLMGSPDSDKDAVDDEKPQHRVRITRPFYLGVHEVTQGQYREVTGETPSHFRGSDDLPVESVNHHGAIAFCTKLSAKEGVSYRLPTEAEWEYACRAGSTTRYSFGDDEASLGEVAWYKGNSGNRTHPVGQKRPNAWGLYDMHGNVWELCGDWFDEDYYGQSPPSANPLGPSHAADRVIRGGGWRSIPQIVRSADRSGRAPGARPHDLGFRLARVQSSR